MRILAVVAALLLSPVPAERANAQMPLTHPWSVASDMPVARRVITFENRSAMLSGTLFSPADGRAHATLIATHGAAAPLHSEPMYRHLIEIMPRLGVAVFV